MRNLSLRMLGSCHSLLLGFLVPLLWRQALLYRLRIPPPLELPGGFCWTPPPQSFLKLNTNGSRNHGTSKASTGGLLRDYCGQWVHGFIVNVGSTSSFLAELGRCREGLKLAHQLGGQQLIVEMDSLLAVQFIQNRKVTVGPTSVLLSDILLLLDASSACSVTDTLREGNSAEDFMAALCHDSPMGTTFFPTPPIGIGMILQGDSLGTGFLASCGVKLKF